MPLLSKAPQYELDDIYKKRPVPLIVTAKKHSSKNWKTRLLKIGTQPCPDRFNDEAESISADNDQDLVKYVVVGVIPITLPVGFESGKGQRGVIGNTLPNTVLKPEAKPAIRVVAERMSESAPGE